MRIILTTKLRRGYSAPSGEIGEVETAMGLSFERIMGDRPNIPSRDHVRPKFLRENAMKVLKLYSDESPNARQPATTLKKE